MSKRRKREWASAPIVCFILVTAFLLGSEAPLRADPLPGSVARVRVTVAHVSNAAAKVVVPGDIQARYQSNISFRTSGKISERLVEIGAHVTADQVLARLNPEQQQAGVRDAAAAVKSSEANLEQTTLTFERQQELLRGRYTTQVAFDQAEQQLRTARAQLESNRAQLASMLEQLGYTDLRAGVQGFITARKAEIGQVVREGETVFAIAQDGPRDAVFNVQEALLVRPPKSKRISVALLADPSVKTAAEIREISPSVDPTTGAVRVKATLLGDSPRFTLGASVIGTGNLDETLAVILPWSSLFRWDGGPAVWVVDPTNGTVSPQRVTIDTYADGQMILKNGVKDGDRVVTAGIQTLRPGLKVAVVEGTE